jgi:hypothetical protein
MCQCTDPVDMFPDERLEEIASILARGVLCMNSRLKHELPGAEIYEESPETGLDLCATSSLRI